MMELVSLSELMRQTGWKRKRLLKPLEAMNESGPLRGLVVVYVGKRRRPYINKAILAHINDLSNFGFEKRFADFDARVSSIELRMDEYDARRSA